MTTETVGVFGLGAMGGRCAARLVDRGVRVTGFDPDAAARDRAAEAGVQVCEDPGQVAAEATIVLLSLPGPAQVEAAVAPDGSLAELRSACLVADLSTIGPSTARAAHRALGARGVAYVDAPVLGRPNACGHWTLPAGGDEPTVERLRGMAEGRIAARVLRVGEVGSGATVKVLNNLMFGAINAVTAEAFAIGRRAGLDPEVFADTVAGSGAATVSPLFRELAAKIVAEDYAPTFELRLLRKDVRLAMELADQVGSPAFVAGCVDRLDTIANVRWPREDTAALVKLYDQIAEGAPNPNDARDSSDAGDSSGARDSSGQDASR